MKHLRYLLFSFAFFSYMGLFAASPIGSNGFYDCLRRIAQNQELKDTQRNSSMNCVVRYGEKEHLFCQSILEFYLGSLDRLKATENEGKFIYEMEELYGDEEIPIKPADFFDALRLMHNQQISQSVRNMGPRKAMQVNLIWQELNAQGQENLAKIIALQIPVWAQDLVNLSDDEFRCLTQQVQDHKSEHLLLEFPKRRLQKLGLHESLKFIDYFKNWSEAIKLLPDNASASISVSISFVDSPPGPVRIAPRAPVNIRPNQFNRPPRQPGYFDFNFIDQGGAKHTANVNLPLLVKLLINTGSNLELEIPQLYRFIIFFYCVSIPNNVQTKSNPILLNSINKKILPLDARIPMYRPNGAHVIYDMTRGSTILAFAIKKGNYFLTDILLQKGANPYDETINPGAQDHGKKAIDYAPDDEFKNWLESKIHEIAKEQEQNDPRE